MHAPRFPQQRGVSHENLNGSLFSRPKTISRTISGGSAGSSNDIHRRHPLADRVGNENRASSEMHRAAPEMPRAFQGMLKTGIESGDAGIFARPARNSGGSMLRLSANSTPRRQRVGSNPRQPQPYHRSQRLQGVPEPGDDRQILPSYSYARNRDTTTDLISMYETANRKPYGSLRDMDPPPSPGYRSQSMTRSSYSPIRELNNQRSYTSFRSQPESGATQRPISPFLYPARLRRPGFRPSSPVLTDDGVVDYSRRVEIERIPSVERLASGSVYGSAAPSSLYAQKRIPSNVAVRRPLPLASPPSGWQFDAQYHSQPSTRDHDSRHASFTERENSMSTPKAFTQIPPHAEMLTPASMTPSKSSQRSPFYYDYTEQFDIDDYNGSSFQVTPPLGPNSRYQFGSPFATDWYTSQHSESPLQKPGYNSSISANQSADRTSDLPARSSVESVPELEPTVFRNGRKRASVEGMLDDPELIGAYDNGGSSKKAKVHPSGPEDGNGTVRRLSAHPSTPRRLQFGDDSLDGITFAPAELKITPGRGSPTNPSAHLPTIGDASDRLVRVYADITPTPRKENLARSVSDSDGPKAFGPIQRPATSDAVERRTFRRKFSSSSQPTVASTNRSRPILKGLGSQARAKKTSLSGVLSGEHEAADMSKIAREFEAADLSKISEVDVGRAEGKRIKDSPTLGGVTAAVNKPNASASFPPQVSGTRRPSSGKTVGGKPPVPGHRVSSRGVIPNYSHVIRGHERNSGKAEMEFRPPVPRKTSFRSQSPMLAPKAISPARMLKLKNSVPQLMKALPAVPRDSLDEVVESPPVQESGYVSSPLAGTISAERRPTPAVGVNAVGQQPPPLPGLPALPVDSPKEQMSTTPRDSPFQYITTDMAFASPASAPQSPDIAPPPPSHQPKLKLKLRGSHHDFRPTSAESQPWNKEENYPWSSQESIRLHSYVPSKQPPQVPPKFKVRVTRPSGSSDSGTVKRNPNASSQKSHTLFNPKDLFTSPLGFEDIMRQVGRHFSGKRTTDTGSEPGASTSKLSLPEVAPSKLSMPEGPRPTGSSLQVPRMPGMPERPPPALLTPLSPTAQSFFSDDSSQEEGTPKSLRKRISFLRGRKPEPFGPNNGTHSFDDNSWRNRHAAPPATSEQRAPKRKASLTSKKSFLSGTSRRQRVTAKIFDWFRRGKDAIKNSVRVRREGATCM